MAEISDIQNNVSCIGQNRFFSVPVVCVQNPIQLKKSCQPSSSASPRILIVVKNAPEKKTMSQCQSENRAHNEQSSSSSANIVLEKSSCYSANTELISAKAKKEGNVISNKLKVNGANNILCSICDSSFTRHVSLKRHIKRFHPDKFNDLNPPKTFKFHCSFCHRRFNRQNDLRSHVNREHTGRKEKIRYKCPLCLNEFVRPDICKHLEKDHNIELRTEKINFPSYEEFFTWKSEMEKDTKSSFRKRSSRIHNNGSEYHYFICHRSGMYVSQGIGKRRLKAQGSNKINAFCPAFMKVNVYTSKQCEISFQSTHVGHAMDISHINLTLQERKEFASKLAANLPLDTILEEVSADNSHDKPHRIHHLTKHDLHNIKSSFGINYQPKKELNEAVKSIIKKADETSHNSLIKSRSSKSAINKLTKDSYCLLIEPEASKLTIDQSSSESQERDSEDLQNYQEDNLAALAISEAPELIEEIQSEILDPSSSIATERQKRIIEEFANLVTSATPKQFELLEKTVLSLPQKLNTAEGEGYLL